MQAPTSSVTQHACLLNGPRGGLVRRLSCSSLSTCGGAALFPAEIESLGEVYIVVRAVEYGLSVCSCMASWETSVANWVLALYMQVLLFCVVMMTWLYVHSAV